MQRKTSKYYIHKEIELLITKLINIKNMFFMYKKIYFNDGYVQIIKQLPKTSSIVLQTLLDRIILELTCLVVDEGENDLSIKSFIKKYKEYKQDYKEKRYVYIRDSDSQKKHRLYIEPGDIDDDINELQSYLNKNIKLLNYFQKYRNKKIAHNDKKINFKTKYKYKEMKVYITYDDIEECIEGLFKYMNRIYKTLCKTSFLHVDELDGELKYLDEALENYHIEIGKRQVK